MWRRPWRAGRGHSRGVESAVLADPDDEMGILIQDFKPSHIIGHLSNEVRVSPTRNQWTYEVEIPWSAAKGINSKFATSPDPSVALQIKRQPQQALRSIGRWCCDNFQPRCHLEWLVEGGRLFIVQIDCEWRQLDNGSDPTKDISRARSVFPDPSVANDLLRFTVGSATRWKKLKNISEFDFDGEHTAPILYELPSSLVSQAKYDSTVRARLTREVEGLTGDRTVVRTDVDQAGFPRFNLPRIDTVSGAEAITWCEIQLGALRERGADDNNIVFLVHAFLPALASAWAYADPKSPAVQIDALWGLPDGLQVLPVDSYEVIPSRGRIIKTPSTFKPMFLQEEIDGRWTYVNVLRARGRSQVLSSADIVEVANRTKSIADKLGEFAQIMWFCGIPAEYGVGRNIPWFRAREKIDPAPRAADKYRSVPVRTFSDLDSMPLSRVSIEFCPTVDLIRSEPFLNAVIKKAKDHGLPVKLNGSVLGHVYYRLSEEGIGIILPNAVKYKRKRERRVFGKIVRDKIPENISLGGEDAVEATLAGADALHGLAAKAVEELEELLSAKTDADRSAELADVLEVVRGMAHEMNLDWSSLVSRADAKKARAGGFEQRKVLLETSLHQAERLREHEAGSEVTLTNIGSPVAAGTRVEIPIAGVMNTIERRPLVVSVPDAGASLQIALRKGKLLVNVTTSDGGGSDDDAQGSLF